MTGLLLTTGINCGTIDRLAPTDMVGVLSF